MKSQFNFPKRLSRKLAFSSSRLKLFLDSVIMPSGRIINNFHVIQHMNNTIVAIVENTKYEICLVRVLRYITHKVEWELPAGGIERGEDYIDAAKREIFEETGISVSKLKHIYSFIPSNGISNNFVHVVKGKNGKLKEKGIIDINEIKEVKWLSLDEVFELIKKKKITDGISLLAIFLYKHFEYD